MRPPHHTPAKLLSSADFSRTRWLKSAAIVSVALSAPAVFGAAAPAGDADQGRALFQQTCALCHVGGTFTTGGQGPTLDGVVGRKAGTTSFSYTQALKDSGMTWDVASLDRFLSNPTTLVPGTNMVIVVPTAEARADLIAFLKTLPAKAEAPMAAAPAAADAFDWRGAAPGVKNRIALARLPDPFATPSSRNNPGVVPRPANAMPSAPAGFTVELFAQGLSGPRLIHVAPNGDLFIAETRANRLHILRAAAGAAKPTVDDVFATKLDRPFGMAFYPVGDNPQWLYVANNNSVVRFPYRNGDLEARGPAEVIVPKLSDTTNGHSTRDVVFSPDGKRMFISIGSGSNVAEGIAKKSPAEVKAWEAEHGFGAAWGAELMRANVVTTDPEGKQPLKVFASGIRNPVGLAIDPVRGDLWTSTNERDGLGDNLVPDYVTTVKEGAYYGWPWYYMGNHEDPRLKGHRPDLAGKATVPDVPLQAHSAALGIAFYTATSGAAVFPAEYRGDLFVALHGSWNRASRTGYKVARVRRQNGRPTGEYEDFLTGFVVDAHNVWGRPVGVAVAHDGALLVTEDASGTVWRVAYSGRK